MLELILSAVLKNKWVYIAVAFLALGYFAWTQYSKAKELEFTNQVSYQNQQAYQDSVNKMRASIQETAIFVRDLNDKNTKLKNEYTILNSKYSILVSSVRDSGIGENELRDSIGIVKFSGKQYIASYDGITTFNFNQKDSSKRTNWTLSIGFDPIDVESNVYFNDSLGLWKVRSHSLTSGVLLRGTTTIDDATLRAIRGVVQDENHRGNNTLGIGGFVSPYDAYIGLALKPSDWMFNLDYRVISDSRRSDDLWYNKIMIGAHYFIF